MSERFPDKDNKAEQYRVAGVILGETAVGIGLDVPEDERQRWGEVMAGLTEADDAFEANRGVYSAEELLEHLGMPVDDENLQRYAGQLLTASGAALDTTDIREHFDYRGEEAAACADLLCHDCRVRDQGKNEDSWEQIRRVSVAGQYLDSFRDAGQDSAANLDQFGAMQLRTHALARLARITPTIYPSTWRALARSGHRRGLDRYLAGELVPR